ncbi:hypothetical protein swp_3301 [Shewanella piezotolerans WP3]|uniref:Uncharacterized protein n=1 Tax=Shewanella piezotolerans (strain WP3 / JCM 13877) TaxID=225849 RepID=B8CRJ6_SHEPW|nr:hypothetical protein swp_3301 [Shewanella piezotolerans WP3]
MPAIRFLPENIAEIIPGLMKQLSKNHTDDMHEYQQH